MPDACKNCAGIIVSERVSVYVHVRWFASHMLFVFVWMEEGGGCVGDGGDSYLPSRRAVAVAFVFEVGDGSHHPVINLGQCQSLVRRALNGFGY